DFASPDFASGYCFQDTASTLLPSGLRVPGLSIPLLLSGHRVHFTAFRTSRPRTSRPRTLRPVIAFRTPRPLYCVQDFASPDFASPDFASGYCFPDSASTLLRSGLRIPGLCVRLLLSGHRVYFTAFRTSRPRTSRPRTLRPVIAFRTPRPLYCVQDFASPDFASGYCFQDTASTLLPSGLRVPGLRVPGLCVRLLLSGLRVHFTAFRTSHPRTLRPVTAFRTPRLLYCLQDFASPDFASPDFASGYCFPDSASTLLRSGLRIPGLCVRLLLSGHRVYFTAFRTSRPRTSRPRTLRPVIAFRTPRPLYCVQDFASPDFASGYCFQDTASTLLPSGLRVPGLRVPGLCVRLLLSGLRVHFTAFRTSHPRTLRPVTAFRTPRLLYCLQDFASPDFASPDFASGYCFPDSASTLLRSGLRIPGLCVRLLLSGHRVYFTAFRTSRPRTSRPRTLRPVIAFRTPRPLYCVQDFASPDFASGYCFQDTASTLLPSGLRVPGLRVPGLCVRLLLSGLRVHFTAFRTSHPRTLRPVTAFRTPRLLYCLQDFASPDFASPDFASGYCFPDSASTLLRSGLRIPGLCVRLLLSGHRVYFTAFRTSRPRTSRPRTLRPVIAFRTPRPLYCVQDFASPDFASGYCFQDTASTLLPSGLRVPGLRVPGLCVRLLLSGLRVHFTAFRTSHPRTLRPVTAFRTPRLLYCLQDFASPDFASPDFASGYCFPDSASTLLRSGLRIPGLCVRLLLSGHRVYFTAFRTSRPRTSRPRTLRPVIAFRTPRPLYCVQDFASPDFASGYCFQDTASTLLPSGLRVPGLRVPGLCVRLLLSGLRVHFTAFRTSHPRTLRPVTAFRTPRLLYCLQDFASPDFASPDFASGYCFPDSASTLLRSGLRIPGLCVRLLLSGHRVYFTAFRTSRPRTSRPRTLRPVIAFRTPRPLYCVQDFASPDFASGYCFQDTASTLLPSGLRVPGLRVPGLCVRLLLSGLRVHFAAFRTSRPRTPRPVTTFQTPRPFYCFQFFASPEFASAYCFPDSASI
ncbi:hypothetical protein CRG98_043479, partial [Punica granatum]